MNFMWLSSCSGAGACGQCPPCSEGRSFARLRGDKWAPGQAGVWAASSGLHGGCLHAPLPPRCCCDAVLGGDTPPWPPQQSVPVPGSWQRDHVLQVDLHACCGSDKTIGPLVLIQGSLTAPGDIWGCQAWGRCGWHPWVQARGPGKCRMSAVPGRAAGLGEALVTAVLLLSTSVGFCHRWCLFPSRPLVCGKPGCGGQGGPALSTSLRVCYGRGKDGARWRDSVPGAGDRGPEHLDLPQLQP